MSHEASWSEPAAEAAAAGHPRAVRLVPFCFWLARPGDGGRDAGPPRPAALNEAIISQLSGDGQPGAQPLRWAITAVDPLRGLQIEGVALCDGVIHSVADC